MLDFEFELPLIVSLSLVLVKHVVYNRLMSLITSGMSNSSSDSASTSSVPKLPLDRGQFVYWQMHMRAYLDDKGVWSVVCAGDAADESVTAGSSSSSSSSSGTNGAEPKGKDGVDGTDASGKLSSPSTSVDHADVGKKRKRGYFCCSRSHKPLTIIMQNR
jgi:hypothetical protein